MKREIQLLTILLCCLAAQLCIAQVPLGNTHAVVLDIRLIQDRDLIIANLVETIEVWNYKSRTLMKRWNAPKIIAMDYRAGKVVGTSVTGGVVVWDLESGTPILEKSIAQAPLITVTWLDDRYFATGGENKMILKVDAATGEVVAKAQHSGVITALAMGKDQNLIAGDGRGTVALYDITSMSKGKSVKAHRHLVRQIVVSDSSNSFYTSSDDGRFRSWDAGTLYPSRSKKVGSWLLSADVIDFGDGSRRGVNVFGKRSGELVIQAGAGTYRADLDAMINDVEIITGTLPNLLVAVATHGRGIQFWDAKEMKFR